MYFLKENTICKYGDDAPTNNYRIKTDELFDSSIAEFFVTGLEDELTEDKTLHIYISQKNLLNMGKYNGWENDSNQYIDYIMYKLKKYIYNAINYNKLINNNLFNDFSYDKKSFIVIPNNFMMTLVLMFWNNYNDNDNDFNVNIKPFFSTPYQSNYFYVTVKLKKK